MKGSHPNRLDQITIRRLYVHEKLVPLSKRFYTYQGAPTGWFDKQARVHIICARPQTPFPRGEIIIFQCLP